MKFALRHQNLVVVLFGALCLGLTFMLVIVVKLAMAHTSIWLGLFAVVYVAIGALQVQWFVRYIVHFRQMCAMIGDDVESYANQLEHIKHRLITLAAEDESGLHSRRLTEDPRFSELVAYRRGDTSHCMLVSSVDEVVTGVDRDREYAHAMHFQLRDSAIVARRTYRAIELDEDGDLPIDPNPFLPRDKAVHQRFMDFWFSERLIYDYASPDEIKMLDELLAT